MKRIIALLLCLCMCVSGLTACGAKDTPAPEAETTADHSAPEQAEPSQEAEEAETPEASEPEASTGKHVELLRLGTTNENDNFNATSQSGILGRINYTGFCQGNMFSPNEQGELVPTMLKDYEISEDNHTLTMVIPTNCYWHDGEPFTINDLKFTFEYNRDVIESGAYKKIDSIEVQGDDTLVVHFNEEMTAFNFINKIGNMSKIYPEHIWKNVDKPGEYMGDDRNIGCGPYKLVELDTDAQISYYEAMPDYWRGELTVDKVSIKTYASQEALVMAMANGEIDAMYDYSKPIATTLYDTVEKYDDLDLGLEQDTGNKMLMMGFRAAPTNDLAFREAIAYAIDYNMLALTVGGKYATVGHRGVTPSSNAVYYNPDLPQMETDFEKAAQMLDEAGYVDADGDGWRDLKDGSPMDLLIVPQYSKSQSETMLRISDVLKQSFEKVNVKATFSEESLTNKETWSKLAEQEGSYNIHLGYCTAGMADYIGVASYLQDSSRNHWWGTCDDEEFLSVYDSLATVSSFDEYADVMHEIQRIIADKVIAIPTCWETAAFPYRTDKIGGWTSHPGEDVIHCNTWYNLYTK